MGEKTHLRTQNIIFMRNLLVYRNYVRAISMTNSPVMDIPKESEIYQEICVVISAIGNRGQRNTGMRCSAMFSQCPGVLEHLLTDITSGKCVAKLSTELIIYYMW